MIRSPLDILTRAVTKPSRLVCGIMSGTSVDAVDVAIARVHGGGTSLRLEPLHFHETLYAEELQHRIFANCEMASSNVNDICLLHTALAEVYADAVRALCHEHGIDVGDIDLIGMHGQTLRHLPDAMDFAGYSIRSTLQIGSGSTLATLLRVPVVYDFRAGDMALGGQGAPLVPYVDALLFRSDAEDRVLLNIGGIANVTLLPRGGDNTQVLATDTGPGNMIIDALMRRFYGREFDENGDVASAGAVNADLLAWMLSHPFFKQTTPKSTGRESFGGEYLNELLEVARALSVLDVPDVITTVTECTVRAIVLHLRASLPRTASFRLLVSGGGTKNRFIMKGLQHAFPEAVVEGTSVLGIDPSAKEALAFAVLANEWLMGNPANIPAVTGASRPALLGALAIPA
ncbi:MAG: anhydro-N-acetylmuramic acid kinase [Bacteroidota bacterium]|jgi:anhydro-N-acetylmuramic acid kinase|nr:anhydro-N-acetylmuramic acid kinase [Bacteroidota bacterium]